MRKYLLPTVTLAAWLAAACSAPAAQLCSEPTRIAPLPPALQEASGIAASWRHDSVLWAHNDSEAAAPQLFAFAADGSLLAEIALSGPGTQSDWEDIEVGPCPAGSCIYIGDIGDNLHDRTDRAILRLPEPALGDTSTESLERFPIRYPDGARDAEALFVLGDTTVFVVSKGRRGAATVYRYPPPLRAGQPVTLEAVQRLTPGLVQLPDQITGAGAARDGGTVAIRSYSKLRLYRPQGDTLALLGDTAGVDLRGLAEPQGEGVTMTTDGGVFLVGETGPAGATPHLSRLRCTDS